jgi:adenylate cyclase
VLWGEILWGYSLALTGRKQEALQFAEEVERKRNWEHKNYALAVIYAGLGDRDQAFAMLETARQNHDYYMTLLRSDSKLSSLRPDSRFNELLRRMNIPIDVH